ncbi:MAG TPA: sulfite exporter TauE/SafE family protein [Azospirillum sp.]|nr:sulfite exporter TauE/SafE family protein [Azospirillum sp.]
MPVASTAVLSALSGGCVGFTLGLIGGGGSVLAVPLLIYAVGIDDPHVAIGTSALAVSLNAFVNLVPHTRAGNVRWRSALLFAAAGAVGASGGSALGKLLNGPTLLFAFGLAMLAVAAAMLGRRPDGVGRPQCTSLRCSIALAVAGLATGGLAGFFGIGGGVLIVPALVFTTGMPILEAIGTSLVSVGTFGLTTAGSYAVSGYINWTVAAQFIVGGIVGGWGGTRLVRYLAASRRGLNLVFAAVVSGVGFYILADTAGAVFATP